MSSIGAISLAGMQSAALQMQSSAARIANPSSGADLAEEIIAQTVAQAVFAASAQAMVAEAKAISQLLDVTVKRRLPSPTRTTISLHAPVTGLREMPSLVTH